MKTHHAQIAIGVAGFLAGLVYLLWFQPTVDQAQARFEASPEGRGYNWPKFHAAKSDDAELFCRDSPDKQMRACTLQTLRIDPLDGKPLGVMPEDFYCTVRGCSWFMDWAEVE